MELCVDAFVPNDSSLVSGRGVGWNGEEEMEVDADDEYIDPNMSMLIVTVSSPPVVCVAGAEIGCREPTTAGRVSSSSRSRC